MQRIKIEDIKVTKKTILTPGHQIALHTIIKSKLSIMVDLDISSGAVAGSAIHPSESGTAVLGPQLVYVEYDCIRPSTACPAVVERALVAPSIIRDSSIVYSVCYNRDGYGKWIGGR